MEPSPQRVLIAATFVAFLYFVPDLLIRTKAEKRREAIRMELPNALDQMLISVQAGLGFEAAMSRSAQNGTGPLADEFTRTLQSKDSPKKERLETFPTSVFSRSCGASFETMISSGRTERRTLLPKESPFDKTHEILP